MPRKPLPTLNLRCEWCKILFSWKLRTNYIGQHGVPHTCTDRCAGRLKQFKNPRPTKKPPRPEVFENKVDSAA